MWNERDFTKISGSMYFEKVDMVTFIGLHLCLANLKFLSLSLLHNIFDLDLATVNYCETNP